ncbi:UvrD-helicase domain-containing protein [Silanimonas sp.]|jgi:exodeoxyribonuclease V beta subunit|uniref:UvrD-helicase domain-containing protein n=1 Tax=Silanimonas sp. TaxID=1929290 RepID=UPI0037CC6F48
MSVALDWTNAPLQGRLQIDASAGTGKTWTMAALYLRLLLDDADGRPRALPEQIVVSTFTEAAAQELGARLRQRVEEALRWSRAPLATTTGGVSAEDPVRAWVRQRWDAAPGQREADRTHLLGALAQLDRAPIGTLHGLCHRILSAHPLESRQGFQPLALGDGRGVLEAMARDLLRRIGAGEPPQPARTLPKGCSTLEGLTKAIAALLQPGVVVTPAPTHEALRALISPAIETTLRALTVKAGHFKDARSAQHKAAIALCAFLDAGGEPPANASALLAKDDFGAWVLPAAESLLRDAQFQCGMASLVTAIEQATSPERAFWAWWWPELRAMQKARSLEIGEMGFDRLIEQVSGAMREDGSPLPDAVFARWPIALVDEFQDTDGAQYALLDRLYRDSTGAKRGLLAMVGDPKQAIYSFRGGDIAAYLAACRDADATLTLDTNQRSSTTYVTACNTLFDGARARLGTGATPITYAPVRAAGRADAKPLLENGQPIAAPLVFHRLDLALPNSVMRPKAIDACAALVVDLLASGRHRLGDRPLQPGDLAVLLVSNAEVSALRRALQRHGVPCAGQGRQTVFDSEWARDLLLALYAVRHPGDAGALRAALLTPLFGLTPPALPVLEASGGLDAWRERFIALRQRWSRAGVLAVVQALIELALPVLANRDEKDGERALTDLRHLGELLQQEAEAGHSPDALLDWMRAQREDEEAIAGGERSLRLESDAKRVRLMTLHASKGLEFPVVLLPTLWAHEHRPPKGPAIASQDADGRRAAVFEASALRDAREALQDERFRLLYVALTRAEHACHVFTLPPDRPSQRQGKKKNAPPAKVDPDCSALDALLSRWPEAERKGPGIAWRPHWPLPPDSPYVAREAVGTAAESTPSAPAGFALPGRYSFSNLSGHGERRHVEASAADDERSATPETDTTHDTAPAPSPAFDEDALATWQALATVRGTGFGQAVHDLFEARAPGQTFAGDLAGAQRALEQHAVRTSDGSPLSTAVPRVAAMLDRCLAVPLPTGSTVPCTLGGLAPGQQALELAFQFHIDQASMADLRRLAVAHGEAALIPEGPIDRLRGAMVGAIDLVFEHAGRFHVLDYKTNALPTLADYTSSALVAAMDAHHYRFQAFLYTLAVHRYLRQRLRDRYAYATHMGPAIYLFVRAAGLAPGLGLWSQHFAEPLVLGADRLFAGAAA